jgi:hypothetical protein
MSSAVHSESTTLTAIALVSVAVFLAVIVSGLAIVRCKRSQRVMRRTAPITSRDSGKHGKGIIIRRVFRADGVTRPRSSFDWLFGPRRLFHVSPIRPRYVSPVRPRR